jgi:hypothetical protein
MVNNLRTRRRLSLVFTLLLFLLGVALGVIVDNARVNWSQERIRDDEVLYESSNVQYLLLSSTSDNENECSLFRKALEQNIAELGYNLDRLLEYEKQSFFRKESQYENLKRRYLLSNIKYWILSKKVSQLCGNYDTVHVLYFYSTEKCDICPNQGVILTYFKNILDDRLLVFPIDVDLVGEEPVIDLMVTMYNVSEYPTLFIDEKRQVGLASKQELGKMICDGYSSSPEACNHYLE